MFGFSAFFPQYSQNKWLQPFNYKYCEYFIALVYPNLLRTEGELNEYLWYFYSICRKGKCGDGDTSPHSLISQVSIQWKRLMKFNRWILFWLISIHIQTDLNGSNLIFFISEKDLFIYYGILQIILRKYWKWIELWVFNFTLSINNSIEMNLIYKHESRDWRKMKELKINICRWENEKFP